MKQEGHVPHTTYNTVVAQPTPFCNVHCDYCYLNDRHQRLLMEVWVAEAIVTGIADRASPYPVTVVWHAGEPLTTGRSHLERLLEPFEDLRQAGKVEHAIQTNATLIDEDWCELFQRYRIGIGVSIDGPGDLNAQRRDRRGREIFNRATRGIDHLKGAGIPFTAIAVVSSETISRSKEILEFFEELGPTSVGFNIEQRINANIKRPLVSRNDVEAFWREVIQYRLRNSKLRVRELTDLANWLLVAAERGDPGQLEAIPTVSWDGAVVVASPELAGAKAPQYDNFVVGNLRHTPLSEIIARIDEVHYVQEFREGLTNCRSSCSFWDYCGGADAAHRFFEHRDFRATQTANCRNQVQAPINALLSVVNAEPMTDFNRHLAQTLTRLAADPG